MLSLSLDLRSGGSGIKGKTPARALGRQLAAAWQAQVQGLDLGRGGRRRGHITTQTRPGVRGTQAGTGAAGI